MIVDNSDIWSVQSEEDDINYQPKFSLVHSNVMFCCSLVSTSLLIGMDIFYNSKDNKDQSVVRLLTHSKFVCLFICLFFSTSYNPVVVLFCCLQILIWIDLNKWRQRCGSSSPVVAHNNNNNNMFREILVDTADPVISILMAPVTKLAR